MDVAIYTDGSCLGNPGPGGWGAILVYGDIEKEMSGNEADSTNNRMELMAAIMALEALKRPVSVTLTSDSSYLKDGITKWIHGWKKMDGKQPVRNLLPIKIYGNALIVLLRLIRSHGNGSKDTQGTP